MKEMFEASVDGQPYDTERWGQYFRPAGVNAPAGSTADSNSDSQPAKAAPAPAPASGFDDEDDTPMASAPVSAAKPTQKAEDILAMIRSRQKQ
jgi:hypothetical protein